MPGIDSLPEFQNTQQENNIDSLPEFQDKNKTEGIDSLPEFQSVSSPAAPTVTGISPAISAHQIKMSRQELEEKLLAKAKVEEAKALKNRVRVPAPGTGSILPSQTTRSDEEILAQMPYAEGGRGAGITSRFMGGISQAFTGTVNEAHKHKGAAAFAAGFKKLGSNIADLFMNPSEMDMIPSSQWKAKGVYQDDPNDPNSVIVNVDKLRNVYLPTPEVGEAQFNALLKATGQEVTPEKKKQLKVLQETMGTGGIADPTLIDHTKEMVDTLANGLISGPQYRKLIKNFELDKRPPNASILNNDPELKDKIQNAIQTAINGGKPVTIETEYGDIPISKDTDINAVDDYMYREFMLERLTQIGDLSKSQVKQDLSLPLMFATDALGLKIVGAMGKGVTKVIPKSADWAAKLAVKYHRIPALVRAPVTHLPTGVIQGATTYYGAGASTSERERNKQTIMAAALGTGLPAAFEMAGATFGKFAHWNAIRKDRAVVNDLLSAETFDDLPEYLKENLKTPETFQEAKAFQMENDRIDREWKVNQDALGYNPRTPENFKRLLTDKTPEAENMRRLLDAHSKIEDGSGLSLEGKRAQAALKETLADSGVVDVDAQHTINRYRNSFESPKELVTRLEQDRPDIAQAFKNKFGEEATQFRGEVKYLPENFYFEQMREILNSSLGTTRTTLPHEVAGFGSRTGGGVQQELLNGLRNRMRGEDTGAIEFELQNKLTDIDVTKSKMEDAKSYIKHNIDAVAMNEKLSNQDKIDLYNFNQDLYSNKPISQRYAQSIKEKMTKAGVDSTYFDNMMAMYRKNSTDYSKAVKEFGDFAAVTENLNPSQYMNRKLKYITTDADRASYAFANNATQPEKNIRYAATNYFGSEGAHPDFHEVLYSPLAEKIPMRQSVVDDIASVEKLIANVDKKYTDAQVRGLKEYNNSLKSYQRDWHQYDKAMTAMRVPDNNPAAVLTALRNASDSIRNPKLAGELQTEISKYRGKFLDYLSITKTDFTPLEQESMWDYLTGNPYTKLKAGALHEDIFNFGTLNSVLKAHNTIGREVIDAYAEVYQTVFKNEMDRTSFHAFFCTPANRFDESGVVFSGAMQQAINLGVDARQALNTRGAEIIMSLRGYDMVEMLANQRMQLSTGMMFPMLVNDTRTGRRLVSSVLNGDIRIPGLEHSLNIMEEVTKQKFYAHLENPLFDHMVAKAQIMKGFNDGIENRYIDRFHADGSYELTPYGKFVDKIYNSPEILQFINKSKENMEALSPVLINSLAKMAEDSGFIASGVLNKFGSKASLDWARHALEYWDFYSHADAPEIWNAMKDYRGYFASVDSRTLELGNRAIAFNNNYYAPFKGAQLQPIRFREQRIWNSKNPNSSSMQHPYAATFEDLRVNHLYGDSHDAIALRSEEYANYDDLKKPLDNLMSHIWSSLMSAQTAHARSAFEAYAIGAEHLGYRTLANWMNDRAGLTAGTSIAVMQQTIDGYIRNLARTKTPAFISVPILTGTNLISSAVSAFAGMTKIGNLMRSASDAAQFSLMAGDRSWQKMLAVPLSPLRIYPALFTTSSEGITRDFVRKIFNKDAEAWKIADEIMLHSYRDPMIDQQIHQFSVMAKAGKPMLSGSEILKDTSHVGIGKTMERVGYSINDKMMDISDTINDTIFKHTKERVEMFNTNVAMGQGITTFNAVKKAILSGDTESAFNMIQRSFPEQSGAFVDWHLNNIIDNINKGTANEALYSFLPAYHDQVIGRFGRITQPQFVNRFAAQIPGVGLFWSAQNLVKARMLQMGSSAVDKYNPEKLKVAKAMLIFGGAAVLCDSFWRVTANGVRSMSPSTMDLLLSDETRRQFAADSQAPVKDQSPLYKLYNYGLFPHIRRQDVSLVDTNLFNRDGVLQGGAQILKEMLGISNITSARGQQVPLAGYTLARAWPLLRTGMEYYNIDSSIPASFLDDPNEISQYNTIMADAEMKGINKWAGDTHNPAAQQELNERLGLFSQLHGSKLADMWLQISPLSAVTSVIHDPFVFNYVINMMMQADNKVDVLRAGQSFLPARQQRYGVSIDTPAGKRVMPSQDVNPFSNFLDMSMFPNRYAFENLSEFLGVKQLLGPTPEATLNNFIMFMDENKLMDAGMGNHLGAKMMNRWTIMSGMKADQAFDVPVVSPEQIKRAGEEALIHGRGGKFAPVKKEKPSN